MLLFSVAGLFFSDVTIVLLELPEINLVVN